MSTEPDQAFLEFDEWERAAWEQCAGSYADSLGDLTRGSIEALLDAGGVGRATHVLDVGTGPGFVAHAALTRGADVSAVDQSDAMVGIARAAGVDATQGPADQLPFASNRFDAVVGGYVLNHLARPGIAVTEFQRVLRPGGRLALTIWDVPTANPVIGLFNPVIADLGLTASGPAGPDPYRFCDSSAVRQLLLNWEDVRLSPVRWSVLVLPGAWFDAIADSTPRTGAVFAQATSSQRAEARQRYVDLAVNTYSTDRHGRIELPAAAVLITAIKPV